MLSSLLHYIANTSTTDATVSITYPQQLFGCCSTSRNLEVALSGTYNLVVTASIVGLAATCLYANIKNLSVSTGTFSNLAVALSDIYNLEATASTISLMADWLCMGASNLLATASAFCHLLIAY